MNQFVVSGNIILCIKQYPKVENNVVVNTNKNGSGFVVSTGLLLIILIIVPLTATADAREDFAKLEKAGYMITDGSGSILSSAKARHSFVPASTTKLITAWLALKHWGEDYRFRTEFYLDRHTSTLWVKAGGDPFLVSEELALIADKIAALEPGKITNIALDSSLFEADLVVPGATVTNNPYDAVPSAIAANFNSIFLKKDNGKVVSAEPQTPLTKYAREFANEITGTSLRVNTGQKSRNSERYFAQLLSKFLQQKGVPTEGKISWGNFPVARADIIHTSSRTLGEIIKAMLKYSTNFIANQIILTLAAEETATPANFTNVHQYMQSKLTAYFSWQDFSFYEGAGLSRRNQLTPEQLVELLVAFEPWRHLLDEIEPGIFAKTGTLTDISTLAGYIDNTNGYKIFAIMTNEKVAAQFTRKFAIELSRR